jgi:hypothetical protein
VSPRENVDTPCGGGCLWFSVFGSPSASHHPIPVHSHRKVSVEGKARIIADSLVGSAAGCQVLANLWIGRFRFICVLSFHSSAKTTSQRSTGYE